MIRGVRIHITGVVQGVGFRPFVYGLARRLELTGWVRNTSSGVDIVANGQAGRLAAFVRALRNEAPPLARIDALSEAACAPNGFSGFEIAPSDNRPSDFQPISADVAICPDCLRELFDPGDRRYRYPFINCTNCGPRFTIIRAVPYDRPLTTMAAFDLCPACAAEYADPADRRFHAQPVACPQCGPSTWMEAAGGPAHGATTSSPAAIEQARRLLAEGRIVAVKGLGGFHLACDAANGHAVAELRRRKRRVEKAFAVMLPDLAAVEKHGRISAAEREQLLGRERPIVILARRPGSSIAREVAPGQNTLGVMLPYTPLHHLLLERGEGMPEALVMTSGNLSEEPIATGNAEARQRLSGLADAFLMHDRDIHMRCDDSVVRVIGRLSPVTGGGPPSTVSPSPVIVLRRSRGYAPAPLRLPIEAPPLLAAGAELKNAFCLARERYAFLSHHIGDLENFETLCALEAGIAHYQRLFRIEPQAFAYDRHPDYLATRYALARAENEGRPAIGVQHHHAHIAACLADNGWAADRPVIGVAFDGTGYGDDGAIWGGEILIADYAGFERALHLDYVPLPGGDRAAREPWRMALAWLRQAEVPWAEDLPPARHAGERRAALEHQLRTGLNAPATSSMGRLFDAIASLAGVRQSVNYEAQAAIELEGLIDPHETGAYHFDLRDAVIDARPVIRSAVEDVRAGLAPGRIAARFHRGAALMAAAACRRLRAQHGLTEVALSGGVWQNAELLKAVAELLIQADFTLYLHRAAPANDGGLALGQAAIAARALAGGKTGG